MAHKRKLNEVETINSSDTDDSDIVEINDLNDIKPECKYGSKFYRKNPSHLKNFSHLALESLNEDVHKAEEKSSAQCSYKKPKPNEKNYSNFNFFFTKVNSVKNSNQINAHPSLGIQG